MKIALIYNPFAGHKRAGKILPEVQKVFRDLSIDADLFLTEYPGHAKEIVGQNNWGAYQGVIAAGGDGTLFEVINGYYQNPKNMNIPLGVLPVGTGNAFTRDLDLDSDHWREAIEVIRNQRLRKVDVGHCKAQDQNFYFLNILGLGFVAEVTHTAGHLKWLGNIAYTLGVLFETLRLNAYPITVEWDGKTEQRENLFVEISNTRYTANFLMAPNAKIDDGLLDITLCGKLTRRELLKAFPKIFTGEHILEDQIDQFQTKKIRIITEQPKVLTPDGELVGHSPIEVTCLQQAINVFWK